MCTYVVHVSPKHYEQQFSKSKLTYSLNRTINIEIDYFIFSKLLYGNVIHSFHGNNIYCLELNFSV